MKNNNDYGFSLIELMVVVAIIGILSAVAVPQFQKFQRKAKQSEAKANLSALYTAQKIFHVEYNSYYRNILAIGFSPEGKFGYMIGNWGSAPNVSTSLNSNPLTAYNLNYHTYYICGQTYASFNASHDPGGTVGTNCTCNSNHTNYPTTNATATTFIMGAAGHLGGSVTDHWTINQRKELINTVNGAL